MSEWSERTFSTERGLSACEQGAFWRSVPRAGILVRLSGHPLAVDGPQY